MASSTDTTIKYARWGALGDFAFQKVTSPSSVQSSRKWTLTPQPLISGYPALQFFGEGEHVMTLSLTLDNRFVDIAKSERVLNDMANSGVARMLVIGNVPEGRFAITSIDKKDYTTTPEGHVISANYTVTLMESKR